MIMHSLFFCLPLPTTKRDLSLMPTSIKYLFTSLFINTQQISQKKKKAQLDFVSISLKALSHLHKMLLPLLLSELADIYTAQRILARVVFILQSKVTITTTTKKKKKKKKKMLDRRHHHKKKKKKKKKNYA